MPLLVFEFLGTTELLVIALVALIIFGPRKLPEIGRTIGKGMAEFKRASEDFKRTWEYEVEVERRQTPAEPDPLAARGQLEEGDSTPIEDSTPPDDPDAVLGVAPEAQTIARTSSAPYDADGTPTAADETPANAGARERESV
jgi:TatA/E family protein of Tat protein translocase